MPSTVAGSAKADALIHRRLVPTEGGPWPRARRRRLEGRERVLDQDMPLARVAVSPRQVDVAIGHRKPAPWGTKDVAENALAATDLRGFVSMDAIGFRRPVCAF